MAEVAEGASGEVEIGGMGNAKGPTPEKTRFSMGLAAAMADYTPNQVKPPAGGPSFASSYMPSALSKP